MNARAQFVRMQDSTAADWQLIGGEFMHFAQALPERIVKHLQLCLLYTSPSPRDS